MALVFTTCTILNYSHLCSYLTPLFARIIFCVFFLIRFIKLKCRRYPMSRSPESSLLTPSLLLSQARDWPDYQLHASLDPKAGKWDLRILSHSCVLVCLRMPGRLICASSVHAVNTPATFSHPALALVGKTEALVLFWLLCLLRLGGISDFCPPNL